MSIPSGSRMASHCRWLGALFSKASPAVENRSNSQKQERRGKSQVDAYI